MPVPSVFRHVWVKRGLDMCPPPLVPVVVRAAARCVARLVPSRVRPRGRVLYFVSLVCARVCGCRVCTARSIAGSVARCQLSGAKDWYWANKDPPAEGCDFEDFRVWGVVWERSVWRNHLRSHKRKALVDACLPVIVFETRWHRGYTSS